ncbi:TonB-linked SusC/RagA family outer membrane protein [Chitinophaga niastensis]|uniref:TonB-linked SusC/RagA family outer membrane protein n=1 Tax=Chitinophaga niastensis TaxID=536980 RepID=A0A2P8HJ60_CHINA|nr:SusC/RagA family TonB-linked outer membrane protein [Chitinophaga niastensis]PSL46256.1 TonB-linked SusC/RagA family outer membrane protein [Chitinophaga niastensis]
MRDHLSKWLSEKKRRWILSLVATCCICSQQAMAKGYKLLLIPRDSTPAVGTDTTVISRNDVIYIINRKSAPSAFKNNDTLDVNHVALFPYTSLQQMVKGNVRGLYTKESSGEPGTEQFMFIRGLATPLLTKKDVYQVQPAVYINGVPLIQDNTLIFDIQNNDYNRLGPAFNMLATVNPDNIQDIQVYKDATAISLFGPRGANGVINIITKNATSGTRKISVNSYFGLNLYDPVYTTNAQYENRFRRPFYQQYGHAADSLSYPSYLRDSSNAAYFGNANWSDYYLSNTMTHSINASISGGSDRANFRFFGDKTQANGIADNTRLDKYTASFLVNMSPIKWLMASAMINANRLDRVRNTSMQDRFLETAYIPDISSPLAPDKSAYHDYLSAFNKGFDRNHLNSIQGTFSLIFAFNKVRYTSRLLYDYNESLRDVFWPSTLMDGANYASNYFGNNQRVGFDNVIDYTYSPSSDHKFTFEAGQSFQADLYKYTYERAYKGISDRIKVNIVNSDPNSGGYLSPLAFANQLVYRYIDAEKQRLLSFYGNINYNYRDLYHFTLTLRNDGSSLVSPAKRWLFTPAVGGEWNLKNQFLRDKYTISNWTLHASWGRTGRLLGDDRYAAGPQYKVDMGWTGNPNAYSYAGVAGLSRPYSYGWIGDNVAWPVTDILTIGTDASFYHNRLRIAVDYYSKDDRNMLLPMPVVAESGYSSAYRSGLHVNNHGVEAGISGEVINTAKFQWTLGISAAYNENTLKALPGGVKEFVAGDRRFEVGKAVDQFWVYENEGIYNNASDIPLNPKTGSPLTFKGVAFSAGDARWKDVNGDFIVNDKDKVMKGHSMPVYTGSLDNNFKYGPFNISFSFYFAGGMNILNQKAAARYDFINHDGQSNLESVKDITWWQRDKDQKNYPVYNPWSAVIPYRADQDLFLENGSFVKLRSLSLGYDLAGSKWLKALAPGITRCYVYATGNNLLTFTKYSGGDPELTYYNGYDNGYVIPVPKTYTVGLKLDL